MDKCPFCGSDNIYFSKKRNIYVCEDCDDFFSESDLQTGDEKNGKDGLTLFFSYGHDKNSILVERIKNDLEKRGHRIWIDKSEIKAGDYWRDDILRGILNSSGIVAFLSEHSTRNPGVCLDELRIAVCVRGAEIKTVLLEPESRIKPPSTISEIQWLDMSKWEEVKESPESDFEKWYADKFSELCRVVESKESKDLSGDISKLKGLLQPFLNSEKENHLLSKNYVGRKWLEESIEDWLDRDSSKALVLYGSPGSGKSSFCANYAHYNVKILGCFFCEWNREYSINPKLLIKTMAFRLATRMPDYRSLLLHQLSSNISLEKANTETLFDFLLVEPLSNLVDGHRETGIIIVDGLDEAEKNGENPVAEVFSKCAERLPRWIRFIFTSRPERNIKSYFLSCDSIDIISDMPEEYDDIRYYIVHSLKEELNQISNKLEIINKMCELSEGVFLYAEMMVEDIKNHNISISEINSFPKGLNSFYQVSMKRKFPTSDSFLQVREMFELLSISETIPEKLVIDECGYSRYMYVERLDKIGSWINRYDEKNFALLSFSHKSLKDVFSNSELSGYFYIDVKEGALKLARYCRDILEKGNRDHKVIFDELLNKYIQEHIGSYYIESENYEELESFMMETKGLDPYWRVWQQFPPYWNHSDLAKVFWKSSDRNTFIRTLQREGSVDFLIWIFSILERELGIQNFEHELLAVYMDMVHMSGDYKKAVKIAEQFLDGKADEIGENEFLSMLSVRRIHNSMFYKPVRNLISEAMNLYDRLDDRFPAIYNELLFLIGGNLGVLDGDWELCMEWMRKSDEFARKNKLSDFYKRNARKLSDCYCHFGEHEKAEKLVKDNISPDGEITGRYEAYLVGALANIYTCCEQDDKALECYEKLRKYTSEKGIVGWKAHSYLGVANINFKLGNLNEALDFANRALKVYQDIQQEWGLIMCSALLEACNSRMVDPLKSISCNSALERAMEMQYGSCVESIKELCDNKVNYFKLYFL